MVEPSTTPKLQESAENADEVASPRKQSSGVDRTYDEARKARRATEKDAALLANRIALLKQEEMRTQKKIEDTKKRTQEIERLQKRNEDRNKDKEAEQTMQAAYDKLMGQKNYNRSRMEADSRSNHQNALYQQKAKDALEEKAIRLKREADKANFQAYVVEENRKKSEAVKNAASMAKSRLNNDENNRQADVRKSYVGRVQGEDQVKAVVESEVQQLERVEMELISKLQKTQAVQKEAYTQLEKVLKVPGSPSGKRQVNLDQTKSSFIGAQPTPSLQDNDNARAANETPDRGQVKTNEDQTQQEE